MVGALEDSATITAMAHGLWDHLDAPPVHRIHEPPDTVAAIREHLGDDGRPVWLAEEGGASVGYLSLAPADDIPLAGAGTDAIHCNGAFVVPDNRGSGVGHALLDTGLAWARDQGLTRIHADWETANQSANRFWPSVASVLCSTRWPEGSGSGPGPAPRSVSLDKRSGVAEHTVIPKRLT